LPPVPPDTRRPALRGVVIALVGPDGRLLMIRRAMGLRAGGKVCFPGGTVEPDESPAAAATREMAEELGLGPVLQGPIWEWTAADGDLELYGFWGAWDGRLPVPNPAEVAEVLWLTPAQASSHPDGLPTNALFVAAVAAVAAIRTIDPP
jgi:8-oxo-dGTP diphosphatase